MKQITEVERGYLAGLFDGEGCIYISKYQGKNSRSPVYTLQAIVQMTSKDAVESCKNITGLGRVYYTKARIEGNRDQWRWVAQGEEAVKFLRIVEAHLLVKSGQVGHAIELHSLRQKAGGLGYIVPKILTEKREYCYRMVMNLKDERDINDNPAKPDDPQIPLF